MARFTKILAAAGVLGAIGLAACEEDVVEIETPDGELSIEEDGDIDIDEN